MQCEKNSDTQLIALPPCGTEGRCTAHGLLRTGLLLYTCRMWMHPLQTYSTSLTLGKHGFGVNDTVQHSSDILNPPHTCEMDLMGLPERCSAGGWPGMVLSKYVVIWNCRV